MRPATRELRTAIDRLPVRTRAAMLDGVRANRIVAGAYSSDGAICPMLAAHREGSRTSTLAFARAWDRFCGAKRPRRATNREVRILVGLLEASLAAAAPGADLGAAVREHQALARARRSREAADEAARILASGRPERAWPPASTDGQGADGHDMSVSPGLMNWISGTMQAGESASRKRTASAMSAGAIISSGAT